MAWENNSCRPKHGARRIEWRCRHRRRILSQSGAQIRRHGRGLGRNDYGQSTVPGGLNGVVAIAAGNSVTVWRSNPTARSWLGDKSERFSLVTATVPGGLNGVVAIAAGNNHSLALKSDGTVVAWGSIFVDRFRRFHFAPQQCRAD